MTTDMSDFMADMMKPSTPAPAAVAEAPAPAPAPAIVAEEDPIASMMAPSQPVIEVEKPAPAPAPAPVVTISQPAEPQITYAEMIKDYNFTVQERAAIDACAKQFDIMDNNQILQFGVGCQKKLTDFSDTALNQVRTKDLGEVGDMLGSVVHELKNFEAGEEKKGIFGVFKKGTDKVETLKLRYAKAESNVNKITDALEAHQVTLMKDINVLDQMYELNKNYFRELSMYICAGKKKLEEMRGEELPKLLAKAQETGLQEDAQAVRDLDSQCNRFEKKLHDLELTRTIALQMAPQIRMIQSNDTMMVEKIQSTIVNTIPLWKSQMVLTLGLQHSTQAAKAQNAATELTNELLKANAKVLKTASIETAKASERGIVDIETLRMTNESLISTLDEVMAIQKEGHEKRMSAEQEMVEIETTLKKKLLEINVNK